MNFFRTSGDSNNALGTWYANLQTTLPFSAWAAPLSQPGCWAYPDMCVRARRGSRRRRSRAVRYQLTCVCRRSSLPLSRVAHRLQVGRLGCKDGAWTHGCAVPPGLEGWTRTHFAAFAIVSAPLVLSIHPSDANLETILDVIGNKLALNVSQSWAGHPGSLVRTLLPRNGSAVAGVQLWSKPLGGGRTAALFINGGETNASTSVTMRELNVSDANGVVVMDVWSGADAGPVAGGEWETGNVGPLDGRFVVFTSQ